VISAPTGTINLANVNTSATSGGTGGTVYVTAGQTITAGSATADAGGLKGISASGNNIITSTLNLPFIVGTALVVIAAATTASLAPALKSRRLSPVEVIRGG
jgi:ABC-type lipoprotein release transport system permease subunit